MRYPLGEDWIDVIPVQDLKLKHRQKLKRMLNSEVPRTPDGDLDFESIKASYPGGMAAYDEDWRDRRLALVAAIVVTDWSWDAARPEITPDYKLLNAESMGEVSLGVADVLDAHLVELTRSPDPKAVTITSSNGRSKASAASLKA